MSPAMLNEFLAGLNHDFQGELKLKDKVEFTLQTEVAFTAN